MAASKFARANLDDIVEQLTTEEAVNLISGVGFWGTAEVPRLGIPSIKVSDGPNGVRGGFFFNGTRANCIPCATALGATWDPALVNELGAKLLGPETKRRAASVLLGPTCNIQRSPLGGRSFESFAEDPTLSGHLAAAYINGIQSQGIAACIKHFVANDQEDGRHGVDSIVSERALREIYLKPFMIAQKLSKPVCYMTAYNRVNGPHCSENPWLLKEVLRGEWKSGATVMSDWFGIFGVPESINAGVDLEMPGVGKWRTLQTVGRSISAYKTTLRSVKERARKVLELVQKVCETNAEVIDGDGAEHYYPSEDDSALMRKAAAASIVLLKNKDNILPLEPRKIKKLAIIGPNAKAAVASGGGSAAMRNAYVVSPYQGITKALEGSQVEVLYHEGCAGYMQLPLLERELQTSDGKQGWEAEFHSMGDSDKVIEEPILKMNITETNLFFADLKAPGLSTKYAVKMRSKLVPREKDTKFNFGLTVLGRAKLWIDGKLVVDNWTRQTRGKSFFGNGTGEVTGTYDLKAGVAHEVYLEYRNIRGPAEGDEAETVVALPAGVPGVRIGGAEALDPEVALTEATELAKTTDVVICVVGLTGEWEGEGVDRSHLELPGLTNDLVKKVVEANPRTVIVCQSGSAVTMPWADSVAGIIQSWYGGNEQGNAIADVLFGKVNPAGRMPLTFPKRVEDTPSFGHFGSENGKVLYAEDLYVGYKGYQKKQIAPLWAFGYGLSYTTFSYGAAKVSTPTFKAPAEFSLTITIPVTNSGSRAGSEVVQVYITGPQGHLSHPANQLRAFKKVHDLAAGETQEVQLVLDKYAVSYWDDLIHAWRADKGKYTARIGGGSEGPLQEVTFEVEKTFEWNGL